MKEHGFDFNSTDVPRFKTHLLTALKAEEQYIRKRRRTRAYSYGAVAALLMLFVGLGFFRSTFQTPASDLISAKIEMTYGFSNMDSVGAAVSALPEVSTKDKRIDVKDAVRKKTDQKIGDMLNKEELMKGNNYAVAY